MKLPRLLWVALVIYLALLAAVLCHAESPSDTGAYCDYQHESARANALLLIAPNAVAALGRSSTSTGAVLGVGVSESLSHYLQGKVVTQLGDSNCLLYRSMNDITEHTQFDIQILTNDIGAERIKADQEAIKRLDVLLSREKELVAAGSSTVFMSAMLESAKYKLQSDITETANQLGLNQAPVYINDKPLGALLQQAYDVTGANQQLAVKLGKLQNWDVTVGVGAGTSPGTDNSLNFAEVKPYVSIQGSWSFGSPARNKALNNAAADYQAWVRSQHLGPIRMAELLKLRVEDTLALNQYAINMANGYLEKIADQKATIQGVETAEAHRYEVQLAIEEITTQVNSDVAWATAARLKKYLAVNFPE